MWHRAYLAWWVVCAVGMGAASTALATEADFAGPPLLAQFGTLGTGSAQFGSESPQGVAVDDSGDASNGYVYVADKTNNRIEKFSPYGQFILMFGKEVNATTKANVCVASEACEAGKAGGLGGELDGPQGVAVGPEGDVYVVDRNNNRVDKYDSSGDFVLAFGKEVDATTKANVCTVSETCQAGGEGTVVGQFSDWPTTGSFIGVDSSDGDVYVGDDNRVQIFGSSGVFSSAIPLTGAGETTALAVASSGNVYVVSETGAGVREVDTAGAVLRVFDLEGFPSFEANEPKTVAVDSVGDVFVGDRDGSPASTAGTFIYGVREFSEIGVEIANFGSGLVAIAPRNGPAEDSGGIAVNTVGDVYLADRAKEKNDLLVFGPPPVAVQPPPAIAPSIVSEQEERATTTGAVLGASIDPNFNATTYYVQYGLSDCSVPGACTDVPVAPGTPLGGVADQQDHAVTVALSGLRAGTVYHYRFVAESNGGGRIDGPDGTFATAAVPPSESCPNETLRLEDDSISLPDCRAYELVTPPSKGGATIGNEVLVSEDGSHLVAGTRDYASLPGTVYSPGGTPDEEGLLNTLGPRYNFVRGAPGWSYNSVYPPAAQLGPISGLLDVSASFESDLFVAQAPGQPEEQADLYRHEPDGSIVHVGPLQASPTDPFYRDGNFTYRGASADLTHVLFSKEPEPFGGGLWPGDETEFFGESSLYEYTGKNNPEPSLVGVSNEEALHGSPINHEAKQISVCGTSLGSAGERDTYNAVSRDGATVFFTSVACGGKPPVNELYARIEGEHTVAISEPSKQDCTACETFEAEPSKRSPAIFQGASSNGSKVFFLSEQELFPGAKADNLYEYNFDAPTGDKVSLVAPELAPSDGEQGGVVRVSQDGSHVYFVSTAELTSEPNGVGREAEEGEDNLYVYDTETGGTAFVATLSGADEQDWSKADIRPVQATPNGRFLVFTSQADLTLDDTSEKVAQIFRYDAQTGGLVRVSIGQGGYNDNGNTNKYPSKWHSPNYSERDSPELGEEKWVSDDGSYVFFESADGLTPKDGQAPSALDGQTIPGTSEFFPNIYEYNDGNVYLISDDDTSLVEGKPAVELIGTDASGSDVFFETEDELVPQDTDTLPDIYDARVDGGFPAPAAAAPCQIDVCQALSTTPGFSSPGSATQAGGGNFPPPPVSKPVVKVKTGPAKCRGGLVKKKGKCVKRPKTKQRQVRAKKAGNRRRGGS
jgi:hypothetical protein